MQNEARVVAISPNSVKIRVPDLRSFQNGGGRVRLGTYLRITDEDGAVMIAMTNSLAVSEGEPGYVLEASPLGVLKDGNFQRGGGTLSLLTQEIALADDADIRAIFEKSVPAERQFSFSRLASHPEIAVPVDGDRFFNKHIAIVGSTGSGKSCSVARILQEALGAGASGSQPNNTHIVIFDLHSEYHSAFPDAQVLDISDLTLPYWLMNSSELQEFFLDSNGNDYNQRSIFKDAVVQAKKEAFTGTEKERISFDTPVFFDIHEVWGQLIMKNDEMVPGARGPKQGPLFGKLSNLIDRMDVKLSDRRLDFLLGEDAKTISFERVLRQLTGYDRPRSNVTILDLSGVPFDVLSITVSLISRILFEFGFCYKRVRGKKDTPMGNRAPMLLVYEEAHKYVPNDAEGKYRACRDSIERIAKEGRKYGITLMLSSQRPSEIAETIFSQCTSFLALRLTNPTDQNYVRRLLPDSLGSLVENLPTLRTGEGLLLGESVVLPSIVQVEITRKAPSSFDIPYWSIWREPWQEIDFTEITRFWQDR